VEGSQARSGSLMAAGCRVTGRQISANILAYACVCQELNPCSWPRLAGGSSRIGESGRTHQRMIKLLYVWFFFSPNMRVVECFHNWPGDVLLSAPASCRAVVLRRISLWTDQGVTADTRYCLLPPPHPHPAFGFRWRFLKSLKPGFRMLCFHFELSLLLELEFASFIRVPDIGRGVWLRAIFKENMVLGQTIFFLKSVGVRVPPPLCSRHSLILSMICFLLLKEDVTFRCLRVQTREPAASEPPKSCSPKASDFFLAGR